MTKKCDECGRETQVMYICNECSEYVCESCKRNHGCFIYLCDELEKKIFEKIED